MAKEHDCTILKKGAVDIIADAQGNYAEHDTGCATMTVGGTGDALAGIVGAWWAQGMSGFDACRAASFYFGACGQELSERRFSLRAHDIVESFPVFLSQQKKGV